MGRDESLSERDRPRVAQPLPVFILAEEVVAVLIHDLAKLRRILLLKRKQRRVVCESFGDPLIAIGLPKHEVAPPLMRRLVNE